MRHRNLGSFSRDLSLIFCCFFRKVEPEFHQHHAFIGQPPLETDDAFDPLDQLRLPDVSVRPFGDRVGIPVAEQDADFSLLRKRAPVTPHCRALALLVRWFAESLGADVARVHPFVQQVDRFPLAAAVDAADQHDYREASVLEQVVLRIEQGLAQLRLLAGVGALRYRVPQFGGFEHFFSGRRLDQ